ncbi:hypothetical protein COY62_00215 [bacterium (Candidatus Howlettbacteria) CG_4_10_14_0_8_um_filter_40_9]|nr:MAG: hypothetical protein COY62_00215 [bacterium (Candidatus Howlettbacteria) CG_4_10_14_0_8_um_filter_40_9]
MSLKDIQEIRNQIGEKLDFVLDGNTEKPKIVFIYARGFGNDFHDRGLSDDIVKKVTEINSEVAFLRFSFSGCGKSEGVQREKTLSRMSEGYCDVYRLIKSINKNVKIASIAFSMGSHILAKYFDLQFEKVILISPSGMRTAEGMKSYFKNKEGLVIDENGFWHIPRRNGTTTVVGQDFWDELNEKELVQNMRNLTSSHKVTFILPMNDEVSDED